MWHGFVLEAVSSNTSCNAQHCFADEAVARIKEKRWQTGGNRTPWQTMPDL